ncbi:MAG: Hsp20 family protein [Candidatus Altiarchaeota archaeon]|nr:Hsp20 family protein [Candidatus Altiarchaeota archaeon]
MIIKEDKGILGRIKDFFKNTRFRINAGEDLTESRINELLKDRSDSLMPESGEVTSRKISLGGFDVGDFMNSPEKFMATTKKFMQDAGDEFVLTVEFPDAEKEGIEVEATEKCIKVAYRGENREEKTEKRGWFTSSTYSTYNLSSFVRMYPTPTPINPVETHAIYRDGVLLVRARKLASETSTGRKRRIPVG